MSRPSRRTTVTLAIIVFLLAFGVRLIGINWGLPTENRHQSLHPDELITAAAAYSNPYFKPGFYNYGSLYITGLKVGAAAGELYGWIPSGANVPTWKTLRGIHQTGRTISALAGAATAALIFLLALNLMNFLGAIIAAFAMIAAPGHMVHSRFQTVDVFAAFLVVLCLWFTLGFARSEPGAARKRLFLLMGLSAGLAAGAKYAGAILLLPTLWACFTVVRPSFVKSGAALIGIFALGFLAATPGVVLETSKFWTDLQFELRHTADGHGLVFMNTPSGFVYHLAINLPAAGGLSIVALGLIGLTWASIRSRLEWMPIVLFFVFYFILIGRAEVKFMRYVIPLVPLIALGAGYTISRLHEGGGRQRWVAGFAVILIAFSVTAQTGSVTTTELMVRPDPRDVAAKWIKSNVPREATIGFVNDPWFYSPPLFPDTGELLPAARIESMRRHDPRLLRYVPADGYPKEWDSRLITRLQPTFVLFSSFEFYDHDRLSEPEFVKTMGLITQQYRLKAQFWSDSVQVADNVHQQGGVTREDLRSLCRVAIPEPHDMMYIRPVIWLFQRVEKP